MVRPLRLAFAVGLNYVIARGDSSERKQGIRIKT